MLGVVAKWGVLLCDDSKIHCGAGEPHRSWMFQCRRIMSV